MNPFWMVMADLRKTLVTSLGILVLLALAFSATVTVTLLERAVRQAGAVSARDFDLVVGAAGSKLDLVLASVYLRTDEVLPLLPWSTVQALKHDARVKVATPLVFADHRNGSPIVGVGDEFPDLRPSLALASGHWPQHPFEAVAGASTGAALHEQFLGSHGVAEREGVDEETHHEAAYTVVGVLARTNTPWDRAYLSLYNSTWLLHGGEHPSAEVQKVSAVLVKPRDFAAAYALRAQYQGGATTAAFPGEVLAGLFAVFDQLKTVATWVGLAFQGLVFAAVLLSLLASLPTKARWIGLLRALGAGRVYIFLTLWLQTAMVFLASGVSGAGLGWLAAQSLALYGTAQTGLALSPTWTWGDTGLLALFWLAGLVGALVPAWRGYRMTARRALLGV